MDEEIDKRPDSQMSIPASFKIGLIGSYIVLQDLRIEECWLQQKGQQMLKQEVKGQQILKVKD